MDTSKTLYLIDGSSYIYRAYHAIRNLSNSSGMPTNAVFGYTRMLINLLDTKQPEYIAVLFDARGPTFRHGMFSDYKANRPPMPEDLVPQLPWIRKVTDGFGIVSMDLPGYEADDLIGTLANRASGDGFEVIIVTGDKDFLQLISPTIRLFDPVKNKVSDMESFSSSYSISPGLMIDVMGLSGDTSDNIPGVPGIGPKTALDLVKTYGRIEDVYVSIEKITRKKLHENLMNHREQAFLSRDLVKIHQDVPLDTKIEDLRMPTPDSKTLSRLFRELEFRNLQSSYTTSADLSEKSYSAVTNASELNRLMETLSSSEIISVDTETTGLDPMMARIVGISLAVKPDEAFYIPCGHDSHDAPEQIPLENALDALKPVLENPSIPKVGQNIKYDWIVFSRHGVELQGVIFDTMLASYLLNPLKRSHKLEQISMDYLGHKMITFDDIVNKERGIDCFSHVPVDQATEYACEDADITLLAYNVLKPKLREAELEDLFNDVEMPLVPVLKAIEQKGIRVDHEKLTSLSNVFEEQLEHIGKEIFFIAGEEFNINSSQQLGVILFDKLGLPAVKKTKKKTAYSTDMEVLSTLSNKHELPALVLQHRTLSKLKSTYADSLPKLINTETGRIHTSFNQTVTATGRLSSSDPNLQNIPIRSEEGRDIRKAFIAEAGHCMVSADYSQIELRILAHFSEDPRLIEAFVNNEDIHLRTASEVFQLPPSSISPEIRRQAKAINFGIIYGMGPYRLSRDLGISLKMARNYIDSYFSRYSGVKTFIDRTIESARQTFQTKTILGRIRNIPDINSKNSLSRQSAERMATNTPIQGSAADLIKLAMIQVHNALKKEKMNSAMILSVHDEILLEVPEEERDVLLEMVKSIMEGVWSLAVPLVVNVSHGKNWAEAH